MTEGEEDLMYQAELAVTRCCLCERFGHRAPECPDKFSQQESPLAGRVEPLPQAVIIEITSFAVGCIIALCSFVIGLALASWWIR